MIIIQLAIVIDIQSTNHLIKRKWLNNIFDQNSLPAILSVFLIIKSKKLKLLLHMFKHKTTKEAKIEGFRSALIDPCTLFSKYTDLVGYSLVPNFVNISVSWVSAYLFCIYSIS